MDLLFHEVLFAVLLGPLLASAYRKETALYAGDAAHSTLWVFLGAGNKETWPYTFASFIKKHHKQTNKSLFVCPSFWKVQLLKELKKGGFEIRTGREDGSLRLASAQALANLLVPSTLFLLLSTILAYLEGLSLLPSVMFLVVQQHQSCKLFDVIGRRGISCYFWLLKKRPAYILAKQKARQHKQKPMLPFVAWILELDKPVRFCSSWVNWLS